MPRDKTTRPCGDCGAKATSWIWCDACQHFVGDECNLTHDCIGEALDRPQPDTDDDGPETEHNPDCDDPDCEGCESDDDEADEE